MSRIITTANNWTLQFKLANLAMLYLV